METSGNALEFEIESDFGFYRVRSVPMLVIRVHEIRFEADIDDSVFTKRNLTKRR